MTPLQQQLAQTQADLAQAQTIPLAAELQQQKTRNHLMATTISELRGHLVKLQKDKEDAERSLRSMAENLKRERDELRQQLEAGASGVLDLEALAAVRDRILAGLKLGKQASVYKSVRLALDKFIQELTETNGLRKP